MVADKQRFMRGDAATLERAAEDLDIRFAHAFFFRYEHRVESVLEAEHGELTTLHHARTVRDDAELQPAAAQLGKRLPHIVAEMTVAVVRRPEMRDEPVGERGIEAPRLHERAIACLLH